MTAQDATHAPQNKRRKTAANHIAAMAGNGKPVLPVESAAAQPAVHVHVCRAGTDIAALLKAKMLEAEHEQQLNAAASATLGAFSLNSLLTQCTQARPARSC